VDGDSDRRRLTAPQRRDRILAAATEVFAEHGFAASSMGEIAGRAGVVASVIYDHFGSKRELHIELIRLHGEGLIARSITAISVDSPETMLRESLDAYFRLVEEDRFAWRFLFRDPPADPEIAAIWGEIHDRATAGIAALIGLGAPDIGAGLGIPTERATWMLAKLSQSGANGLAQWWYEHPEVPRSELVELSLRALWGGFAGMVNEPAPNATR